MARTQALELVKNLLRDRNRKRLHLARVAGDVLAPFAETSRGRPVQKAQTIQVVAGAARQPVGTDSMNDKMVRF